MKGLMAWILAYWVFSVPPMVIFVGRDFDTWQDWLSTIVIVVVSWVLANRVQKAVDDRG